MDDTAEMLARYHEELAYLRGAGQNFARKHPKIAERLELDREGSADPHIERLIESFAFLTSRVQYRLDAGFPEFTGDLLSLLYPNLANPVPPMTIAQIVADPARGKLNAGYVVPARTQLFAQTNDGLTCRFRTAYPVTLWPLEVSAAGFVPRDAFEFLDGKTEVLSVLRLRLEARSVAFSDLELGTLRFHLNGPQHVAVQMYELLFKHCTGVALWDRVSKRAVLLPAAAIKPVGFAPDEAVIPDGDESHPAYRLMQEYFWLPEKFLFFDLSGLEENPSLLELEVLFLMDTLPRQRLTIRPETFSLGCTPVVNLFPRTSEPIRVDETRTEYRLVADARREPTTEIHSIVAVSSSSNPAVTGRYLRPIYGAAGNTGDGDAFWHSRRLATERSDATGTDLHLGFVDFAFNPAQPPTELVFAHLLCTNRDLATQLAEGSLLQTEYPGPIGMIQCLRKPTQPGYPPLGGATRWALISNLRLNYLSLADRHMPLAALRRILELYSLSDAGSVRQQLEGILALSVRKVMRRVPSGLATAEGHAVEHAWQSFRRGFEVRATLNRPAFPGASPHLFATVLSSFLQLYAPLNSFLDLKTTEIG